MDSRGGSGDDLPGEGTHDYPDFRFLVEPREMSDEQAFRVADLGNRSRKGFFRLRSRL